MFLAIHFKKEDLIIALFFLQIPMSAQPPISCLAALETKDIGEREWRVIVQRLFIPVIGKYSGYFKHKDGNIKDS